MMIYRFFKKNVNNVGGILSYLHDKNVQQT